MMSEWLRIALGEWRAIAVGAAGFLLGSGIISLYRRKRRLQAYVRNRSEWHDALLLMVEDWLLQPEIVGAMLQARVARPESLSRFRSQMGSMAQGDLQVAVGCLLAPRRVRQLIAKHVSNKRGGDRGLVMHELRQLVEDAKRDQGAVVQ